METEALQLQTELQAMIEELVVKKGISDTNTFIAYTIYLPIAVLLTLYVAHMLFKNARIFMMDIFHGREEIALSTNRLFEIGFYLLNVGFALLILRISDQLLLTKKTIMEVLSFKIGGFAIYLGLMLFINMFFFFRGRRVSRDNQRRAAMEQEILQQNLNAQNKA